MSMGKELLASFAGAAGVEGEWENAPPLGENARTISGRNRFGGISSPGTAREAFSIAISCAQRSNRGPTSVPSTPKTVRPSRPLERPAVGVAVVAVPLGKGYDWRLWVGSVCGRPTALDELASALRGLPAHDALAALVKGADEAAANVEADDDLRGSADYKRHLVGVLARRAAEAALGLEKAAA